MHDITVEPVTTPTAQARQLVDELDRTLAADYAPEQRHGLAFEAIFAPNVRFFIARLRGEPAGCGGTALFAAYAEVKRMYVRDVARGSGVSQALLARIEAETAAHGLELLRLETGVRQVAALRFYERAGFRACAAFGSYASMAPAAIATSVFLEKRLTREGRFPAP